MKRITLPLVLALAVVIGVFVLLNSTIKPIQVVVAKQDLMAGTLLTQDLVEVRTMQRGNLPAGTYSNSIDVIGKTLVVARVAGDALTTYVVGDAASASGIPAMLEPNTVAIAVRVDQATGLAGVLRPGQTVTIIGIIDPSKITQGQASMYAAAAPDLGLAPTLSPGDLTYGGQAITNPTPAPPGTQQPPVSPAARVAVPGLKVLVVPQSFRYEEVSSTSSDGYLPARTTAASQSDNVILLQASIVPTEIAPGVFASPAEVLALLNDVAMIHMVLEPASGVTFDVNAPGIDLAKLYEAITGYKLIP
ncbi:MAG: RcpC/CpaB family pilus assembly protein [Anaerolineales bacterium]